MMYQGRQFLRRSLRRLTVKFVQGMWVDLDGCLRVFQDFDQTFGNARRNVWIELLDPVSVGFVQRIA